MDSSTKLLAGIIAAGIVIFAITQFSGKIFIPSGKYNDFAKCLADSGTTMYGAYWCTHCQDQKKLFGSSVKYINYVECDPKGKNANPSLCESKGIKGYPMWEFPDGSFTEGPQSLELLAVRSGCKLP